eukprot:g6139.t1
MTSRVRTCFTFQNVKENIKQDNVPQGVEVLRQANVYFKPIVPVHEPLAPCDLLPFGFPYYMPWVFFYDYQIEFQRLVEALRVVSQKYIFLNGRISQDETGRYCVEVGSYFEKEYDFPVVEINARMPMAEAILQHGRITTKSADYPVHPNSLPFYLESLDMDAIHKGQDPFLKVKLTHFSDGSCLSISMSHLLMDGMRFSELFRDISRAYCRKEVSMRDIKREYMMFESFSKHFHKEDKEGCVIPKTMPTGREPLAYKQYLNESSSIETLYLSKELIDGMKSRLEPFIPKGSLVSTANIMQALLWMLSCEINSDEIASSKELDIVGTTSVIVGEFGLHGYNITPRNYLGNGIFSAVIFAGENIQSKSLLELQAALALLARRKQIEITKQPNQAFELLVGQMSPISSIPEESRGAVSNLCKLPISEVDFGRGSAQLFLCHVNFPVSASLSLVTPVFRTNGILLHLAVTQKQKAKMKASSVLRNCAPGIKSLFDDFGVEDLKRLMQKN